MPKTDARSEILNSIRLHLAASKPYDDAHQAHHAHNEKPPAAPPLVTNADLQNVSLIERFRENLISIGGNCEVAESLENAAAIAQQVIEKIAPQKIAYSDSATVGKLKMALKTDAEFFKNASAEILFETDLGITSAQFGIAETGTLVLESSREFHRLTSLVPPVHICLLDAKNLRETLGETLAMLEKDLSKTITFITGPSRTSDIELTLAIGVHGPAELHVIILNTETK